MCADRLMTCAKMSTTRCARRATRLVGYWCAMRIAPLKVAARRRERHANRLALVRDYEAPNACVRRLTGWEIA